MTEPTDAGGAAGDATTGAGGPRRTPRRRLLPRAWCAVREMFLAGALVGRAAPWTLTSYVLLTVTASLLPVAAAWLTKLLIDALVAGPTAGTLLPFAAGLTALGVVTGTLPHGMRYLHAELDRAVSVLAQDRLFGAVDRFLGLARFEDPHFLDRMRLAQQAGGTMPSQTVDGALGVGRSLLTIVGFFGSLLVLSPLITVLVLLAAAPTLVAQVALSRRRAQSLLTTGPTERREFFYAALLSTMEAAKEIRLFGSGALLRRRMLIDRRMINRVRRGLDRREILVQASLGLLAALVSGVGLLWAVDAVRQGRLTVGDLTVFVAAVAAVQGALATLASEFGRTHYALLMFRHYLGVITAEPDLPVATAPAALPSLRQGIELRDVWFRYSDEHPWVLRGVDLWLPAGRTTALLGLNGAGKSTLIKLLCRFYDPTRGSIRWDGVDIREVDVTELRGRMSGIFQDYMHYEMTAGDNIRLGDPGAAGDEARLRTAASAAGIHSLLKRLPQGYETLLSRMFFADSPGEEPTSGTVLSGGQWQRLALARAFYREHRELVLLDEPSAGLDAEAEHDVYAALRRRSDGQTCVIISHRLGTARAADVIVVLRQGQIVEQGGHADLLASGGQYARLFTAQAAQYREGDEEDSTMSGARG